MGLSNRKKFLLGLVVLVLVLSIPLTVFLLQRQQQTQSKASASTTLSLVSASSNVAVGSDVYVDIMINPGTNAVTFIKNQISFNPTIFQLSSTAPYMPNTTSFPVVIEGPIVASNSVFLSVSIGNDPTKVVTQTKKVGTLHFKAIKSTATPSNFSFGSNTLVLSSDSTTQSNQNALSTTIPLSLTVSGPSPTPGSTGTPTPATQSAQFNLNVLMHAIGASGDNINPSESDLSNKNPLHATRSASISFYNASNLFVASVSGNIYYSSSSGNFVGTVNVGSLATGNYTIKVKTDHHLIKQYPGFPLITNGQSMTLQPIHLVAGDIDNSNALNILDYNLLIDCYSDLSQAAACNDDKKLAADLNDDGSVNASDYNLFLREITYQSGN